jgi:hypothetical protein
MMITFFFSSFNLCRPVCCRTCHCPSLLKFHLKQAIWYLRGYLFAFDLDQCTCLLFLQSHKLLNATRKKNTYIYIFFRPAFSSSLYWLDYSATNIDTNKVILTNICTRVCACNIDRARSTFVRFVIQIVTGTNLWQAGSFSLSLLAYLFVVVIVDWMEPVI